MLYFDRSPLTLGRFPNGEIYLDTEGLKDLDRDGLHTAALRFEGNDDLVALVLLKGQLDDLGFRRVRLLAPFFPYSTMDHTDGARPLSLKYVARLINSLCFEAVELWEPHSTVTAALLDRAEVRETTVPLALGVLEELGRERVLVCFPDAGAEKRYAGAFKGYRTATFQKERDFATGEILGTRCLDSLEGLVAGTPAVLVDDLCRGGRTFLECGKLLRRAGVGEILLCVTHAEAGILSGPLLDSGVVDRVYATDSCLSPSAGGHERLTIYAAFEEGRREHG